MRTARKRASIVSIRTVAIVILDSKRRTSTKEKVCENLDGFSLDGTANPVLIDWFWNL